MGLDCQMIAKKRDGTIVTRSLDRWYVFTVDFLEHESFEESFSYIDGKEPRIKKVIEWCVERLHLMNGATNETLNEELPYNWRYHMHWVSNLLECLLLMQSLEYELEWVGVFDENNPVYEEYIFTDSLKTEI